MEARLLVTVPVAALMRVQLPVTDAQALVGNNKFIKLKLIIMKKLIGITLLFAAATAYSVYASCSVDTPCGGGRSVSCTGSCSCNQVDGGVSCDGAQTCCPQR